MLDNACMAADPFAGHPMVLVTLNAPREKFWGRVLSISAAGVSLRGIDLQAFAELMRATRAGEALQAATVFFPMHRIERIELDIRSGEIPALAERFRERTGQNIGELMSAGGQD
jgi:hypothetical protein